MAIVQGTIPSELLNDADVSPTESTLIHPYPGSMPAYLAARLCERYSNAGDTVFDPFCGSGSVLVEAMKQGRIAYGADLLEIPVSIARSALTLPNSKTILTAWRTVHVKALKRASLFSEDSTELTGEIERLDRLGDWLHPVSFRDVVALEVEIRRLKDSSLSRLFLLILAASLPSLSKRASRGVLHWGWIADNVVPQKYDLLQTDPFQEVTNRIDRLTRFLNATGHRSAATAGRFALATHNWLENDLPTELSTARVNTLITSPPYPYSIDYSLALRLSGYLLNANHFDSRQQEIGARYKRKRRQRGSQYLQELRTSLSHASSTVIRGGCAVFVLPNPAEYTSIVDMETEQWIEFLRDSLHGTWRATEYGYRECTHRRLVHRSRLERRELIASFTKL